MMVSFSGYGHQRCELYIVTWHLVYDGITGAKVRSPLSQCPPVSVSFVLLILASIFNDRPRKCVPTPNITQPLSHVLALDFSLLFSTSCLYWDPCCVDTKWKPQRWFPRASGQLWFWHSCCFPWEFSHLHWALCTWSSPPQTQALVLGSWRPLQTNPK